MALVLGDRVKVRSRTTGTGDILLENTVDGFQGFDAIGDGNETFYSIVDAAGNWEVGRGTYIALTSTLVRDSILSSSNANAKVNFPAGSKNVFCTYPASIATTVTTGGGLSSDSFKYIAVAGQSDVVADSATDTLTLVAGTGIDITTNASTDTITISGIPADRLVNGLDEIIANVSGGMSFPFGSTQRDNDSITCATGVDTVIYTSTQYHTPTFKLLIRAEAYGNDIDGNTGCECQSCEMIIARSQNGPTTSNKVASTVYGIVHTSTNPLATFSADWNPTTSRVEVLCMPTNINWPVYVRTFVTEIQTSD